MNTITEYLPHYLATLTWLDLVDVAIVFSLAVYGIYRTEQKINPLLRQVDELTQANEQARQLSEQQTDQIFDLRQRLQDLEYYHREVTEMFSERNRYRDN